jgi:RimJ/RimL family protein N-acetyltransferase
MMQPPVLSLGSIRLRPLRRADFAAFAALHAGPHAALMWALASLDEAWRMFLALAGEWSIHGFGMWAIADRDGDGFLGHAGFLQPHDAAEPELGWAVTAAAEGKGIAFVAAQAVRDWGRAQGIVAPVSHIDARNARSIRLAERLGARLEGRTIFAPDAVALHYRHPVTP